MKKLKSAREKKLRNPFTSMVCISICAKPIQFSSPFKKRMTRGFVRCRPYWTSKDNSRLPDMVARGTQADPRRWPRPERVFSPARATALISPTWPHSLSHYSTHLCMIDSIVTESSSSDYCRPFCNKLLKHIMCLTLLPTGRWKASSDLIN